MRRLLPLAAALIIVTSGCSDSGSESSADGGTWTVLHYSMADTDLEPFMVADLNEMGEVGSGGDLQLRAMFDRSPEYSSDDALDLGDWVGAKVIDVGEGTGEVVEDLGDVDMASSETLATFIAQGIEDLPADHYSLIISDHGASWPGIGPDESSENAVLNLAELTEGIASGLEEAGVEKFDLLGFDACLMASYEVASAVAPLADRMVASQELEPGHGWDYGSLSVLQEGANVDEFGTALVNGFASQAEDEGTEAGITLALLDLTKMNKVDAALGAFTDALAEDTPRVAPAVGRAHATTLGFARSPDETEDGHLRDLGQMAEAIGAEGNGVAQEAKELQAAIGNVVLKQVAGEATEGATGLSIYFPPIADLAADEYGDVSSAEAWRGFLSSYYAAGEAIPEAEQPSFTDAEGDAEIEFDEDGGVFISGAFNEAGQDNLTEAIVSYALVNDDGSLTYFGEEFGEIDEDGKPEASAFYDLTALKLTDGEDEAYAYISLFEGDDEGVYAVDVPMAYYESAEDEEYDDVLLSLSIDAESGDIIDETYYVYDEETGGYGELDVAEGGIVVPEVLKIDAEGNEIWEPTTDVGLYADLESLDYELEPLESGTKVQLDLTVYDYGDNSDTISSVITIP
ncbi:MAG: clostripain-related cysteine peptidase [Acidimicrobiales bacterium]|nr:clostripain-related cysteine peptidase [Acidimicrobiales bacterium]